MLIHLTVDFPPNLGRCPLGCAVGNRRHISRILSAFAFPF
jgi:hypothetical protein